MILETKQADDVSESVSKLSRRHLLLGQLTSQRVPIRPPWAIAESLFSKKCTRCEECIKHCETHILIQGDGGYPEIDFSHGECTFCQACVDHCQPQALSISVAPPWALQAQIADSCLAENGVVCISCRDQCPEQAIRMQPRLGQPALPVIVTERCNGCGACYAPCPVQAIEIRPSAAV